MAAGKQIHREHLTDEQWHHFSTVICPVMRKNKAKALRIIAAKEAAADKGLGKETKANNE